MEVILIAKIFSNSAVFLIHQYLNVFIGLADSNGLLNFQHFHDSNKFRDFKKISSQDESALEHVQKFLTSLISGSSFPHTESPPPFQSLPGFRSGGLLFRSFPEQRFFLLR